MRDQREIWKGQYQRSQDLHETGNSSELAVEAANRLRKPSRVLELGCGVGMDAAYFAAQGHEVLGLDFASQAIAEAREFHASLIQASDLRFELADLSVPLTGISGRFDLVFARLSLHYFSDARTRALFAEIAGLLDANGLLIFMCRSTEDRLYGKGVAIEADMFESNHVRHFFSEDYARACLKTGFDVLELTSERGTLYGSESAYVKAIAMKR